MRGERAKPNPDRSEPESAMLDRLERAHERRLVRLGFDIHDGPLQDLALLAEDLRLLRRQLTDVLSPELAPLMLGRIDDLDAQLAALDTDLRRISASVQSGLVEDRTVREGLEQMVSAFAARTGVQPRLHAEGELETLTDSQRLALLSIVGEALNNVREHSQAAGVEVAVSGGAQSFRALICDDGVGFDVEETLMRSARDGHLGLVGLHERARLLGGSCEIDSRAGGPTKIAVTLPRWRPSTRESGGVDDHGG